MELFRVLMLFTLQIYLDGPYGAPSSHIFRAQHAVLIATGIGVTPFASILQSIMHRYWKARHTCPKCKFSWASDTPASVMKLRKVTYFIMTCIRQFCITIYIVNIYG